MPSKRARACDACHSIKIKCALGSTGGNPPCERCLRLGKDCVVTPPVRQKDRVAELEAKIEALTKLLNAQNLSVATVDSMTPELSNGSGSVNTETPPKTPPPGNAKKRRREGPLDRTFDNTAGDVNEYSAAEYTTGVSLELDTVVPQEMQKKILNKYRNEIQTRLSLASLITNGDYSELRKSYPVLLQVVIYAACSGMVSTDVQEGIAKVVFDLISPSAITKTKKSMELVQALQLAAFWYHIPKYHSHLPVFQLVELAIDVSEEIGIGGPKCSISGGEPTSNADVTSGDAWRTWNACYLYSALSGILLRTPHPISWSPYQEISAFGLDYCIDGLSTDRLLCQLVRAMRLCEKIVTEMNLMRVESVADVADPITQVKMHGLQNLITDWKAQIPASLASPILKMWEHFATLFLHECTLHTVTNRESFSGPYVAERLSVTDFPTPIVTPDHEVSLHAIRDAGHALLDIFTSLDIPTFLGFPPGILISQALYTQWILVKLLVSVTGLGNSYGAFIDPDSLQVEQYLTRLINMGAEVDKIDSTCVQARILDSSNRMKEWVCKYNQSHGTQSLIFADGLNREPFAAADDFSFRGAGAVEWEPFAFNDPFEYGLEDLFAYEV